MKVLFACHRVPFPPKRGGKIRPFNIIRHLTDSGHSVTVASLARNEAEAAEAAGHYGERVRDAIKDAGDAVGNASQQLSDWLSKRSGGSGSDDDAAGPTS